MTPIDKALYELFSDKTLSEGCVILNDGERYGKFLRYWDGEYIVIENHKEEVYCRNDEISNEILGHEPQLHDVFRVAKERHQPFDISLYFFDDASLRIYDCHTYKDEDKIIPGYNPTLSLINQSEETKLAIINLFTND